MAHGVRLLAARPQAASELTRKLARLCAARRRSKLARLRAPFEGVPDCATAAAGAVAELAARGLVDDAAYAGWHVAQRAQHRPRSVAHLRGELGAKGVTGADADGAVAGADEPAAALALARRRQRAPQDVRAVTAFLARRGFPWAVATAAARQAAEEAAAEVEGGAAAAAGGAGGVAGDEDVVQGRRGLR